MQPCLLIIVLPREAHIIGEGDAVIVGVFIGQGLAKGCAIPAPHDSVGAVADHPRGVEMIGMDGVGLAVLARGDRNVVKVDRFLLQGP